MQLELDKVFRFLLVLSHGSFLTDILFVLQDVGISHSDDSDGSEDSDSDSDNFSVEFEVESIDSDDYSENDEDSVPGDDEV